jgi:hypothetical protein
MSNDIAREKLIFFSLSSVSELAVELAFGQARPRHQVQTTGAGETPAVQQTDER